MSARIDPGAGDDVRISRSGRTPSRTTVPVRPVRASTATTTKATGTKATGTKATTTTHLPPRPVERSRRKAPLAWLPLAALAALAALVLLSLLVINAVGDDGPDGSAGGAPAPATSAPALRVGEQDLPRAAP